MRDKIIPPDDIDALLDGLREAVEPLGWSVANCGWYGTEPDDAEKVTLYVRRRAGAGS